MDHALTHETEEEIRLPGNALLHACEEVHFSTYEMTIELSLTYVVALVMSRTRYDIDDDRDFMFFHASEWYAEGTLISVER